LFAADAGRAGANATIAKMATPAHITRRILSLLVPFGTDLNKRRISAKKRVR
jgi:hypothetical protein